MNSIAAILAWQQGDLRVLRQNLWLRHLALTHEQQVNLERVQSLEDIQRLPSLRYTLATLERLETALPPGPHRDLLEEVLCWCEVAKAGQPHTRQHWSAAGYNLAVHNIGSAEIYLAEADGDPTHKDLVAAFIATHGLLGQFIRGEVPLVHHRPLYSLVEKELLTAADLEDLLLALNDCVVGAVSPKLWQDICPAATEVIGWVANGDLTHEPPLQERLRQLRVAAISHGEDFDAAWQSLPHTLRQPLTEKLANCSLWFVEAALQDFSFEEFIQILLLAMAEQPLHHLSFEPLMRSLYYQRQGQKQLNLYKKRVIEQYLADLPPRTADSPPNPHVHHQVTLSGDTAHFDFVFSPAGEKLIEFCTEAEKAGVLYEQAILLLFDLFGLRRDKFDRFYNESQYLATMNSTTDSKRVLLYCGAAGCGHRPRGRRTYGSYRRHLPGKSRHRCGFFQKRGGGADPAKKPGKSPLEYPLRRRPQSGPYL